MSILTPEIERCKKGCGEITWSKRYGNEECMSLNLCPTCQATLSTLLECEKLHEDNKFEELKGSFEAGRITGHQEAQEKFNEFVGTIKREIWDIMGNDLIKREKILMMIENLAKGEVGK